MNASRLFAALVVALFGLTAASPALADPYRATEHISRQLQAQAGQLSAEIRGNFRHAPNFAQLVVNAQQVYGQSAQTAALARAHAHPNQLLGSIRRLERLAADLENQVDAASFRRTAYRGYGAPASICDTRHAQRMLLDLANTLANLEDAAIDLSRSGVCQIQPNGRFDDDFGRHGRQGNNRHNSGYRGRGY